MGGEVYAHAHRQPQPRSCRAGLDQDAADLGPVDQHVVGPLQRQQRARDIGLRQVEHRQRGHERDLRRLGRRLSVLKRKVAARFRAALSQTRP
jgi:hypothetical protein